MGVGVVPDVVRSASRVVSNGDTRKVICMGDKSRARSLGFVGVEQRGGRHRIADSIAPLVKQAVFGSAVSR